MVRVIHQPIRERIHYGDLLAAFCRFQGDLIEDSLPLSGCIIILFRAILGITLAGVIRNLLYDFFLFLRGLFFFVGILFRRFITENRRACLVFDTARHILRHIAYIHIGRITYITVVSVSDIDFADAFFRFYCNTEACNLFLFHIGSGGVLC